MAPARRAHRRLALLAALAAALAAGPAHAAACPQPRASAAYTRAVTKALSSGRDLWGERLLHAPGGPTYAAAARYLHPLLYARTSKGRKLTDSGVYYVPLGDGGSVALHVADGGEILRRRANGPKLTISVDGERYGSCLARLGTPALARGWLPILETRYRDARGVRWRQESFTGGGRSYVRLTASRPARARVGATARTVHGSAYFAWPGGAIDADAYAAARAALVSYWQRRLATGTTFVVPERRVLDAERALEVQNLLLSWHYSLGNPYEEFSFPESVDDAQVLAEYGFEPEARTVLRASLTRRPRPYPNWKMGEKLLASAEYVRLSGDRAYAAEVTPTLRRYLAALGSQLGADDLLGRERYSSDIPDQVYGLHSQAVVWASMRDLAASWPERALAAEAGRLAARLRRGLGRAVARSERRLPDGSLFVPVRLLDDEPAYENLTASRDGSYWNLVMPYALASRFFPPGSREARGILAYLERHGSRLLGLVRAGAFSLYGHPGFPTGGTDQVYGLNVSRFLADNDRPDQLVLSLYGQLAAGMARGTFVAGEGATVFPLDGAYYRAMYLPPNATSNAAFLETLRLALVHETPAGLELAFATPRAWLAPGKRIEVTDAPTSFGPLSYSLVARKGSVEVSIDVPARARTLRLRLRLPHETRTLDLSGRHGHVKLRVGSGRDG